MVTKALLLKNNFFLVKRHLINLFNKLPISIMFVIFHFFTGFPSKSCGQPLYRHYNSISEREVEPCLNNLTLLTSVPLDLVFICS